MPNNKFDFKDINLIPNKCIVNSRSECDTSIKFGNHIFKLPVVPANMECVINEDLAIKLASNGFFYVMHRFDVDQVAFVKKMKSLNLISSISIGVGDDSLNLLIKFASLKLIPDFITIDIAHGHSIKMENTLKYIAKLKTDFGLTSFIIAGNVCTPEAVQDLESWGADAIKIGIAPGKSCTTAIATAFGSRNCQASMIKECATVAKKPLIADGGIRTPGDVSIALVMGASMCMIGSMLTGFNDSPGNIVEYDNKKFKEYWGSASQFQSNKTSRIEGEKNLIEFKDKSILDEMKYIEECLQSAISYGGGKDLSCFNNVKYI